MVDLSNMTIEAADAFRAGVARSKRAHDGINLARTMLRAGLQTACEDTRWGLMQRAYEVLGVVGTGEAVEGSGGAPGASVGL